MIVLVAQGIHIGIEAVVHIALPHHLAKFLGIEDLHAVHVGLGGHGGVEVHFYLAFLAGLGGDDDDAVGGAAAVDGSGSSVLEHLDGLDVVTVELVHTGLGGHTVNDVQRVFVVEGADTADADRSGAGRGTVGTDVHAGNASLQSFHRVVLILFGHVCCVYRRDGTGEVGLSLDRVAGYHHLVQQLGVFVHDNGHLGLGRKFKGGVPDGGKDQDGTFLDGKGKVAVKVCDGPVVGSFFLDGGADNAVAVGR